MVKLGSTLATAAALFLTSALHAATPNAAISNVSVTPSFFNPSIGQRQSIHFQVARAGTATIEILDRDRFPIRSWDQKAPAGAVTATWDGKDQEGNVVADEAYNLRLTLHGSGINAVYDPSLTFQPTQSEPKVDFFSREDGVLGYTLREPSRVHAQAGEARMDPETKKMVGPVLKTLIDDGPRVAGSVIEKWNGMDEGGSITVTALPDFVVAVFATSLPPSSMITVGNRALTFFDYARARRPAAVTKPRDLRHSSSHHHAGLTALEDRTPPLTLEPDGSWKSDKRTWRVSSPVKIKVTPSGDSAPYFLAQPTTLWVYVDGKPVRTLTDPQGSTTVSLAKGEVGPGAHRIAFNWASSLGPTAVGSIAVEVASDPKRGGE